MTARATRAELAAAVTELNRQQANLIEALCKVAEERDSAKRAQQTAEAALSTAVAEVARLGRVVEAARAVDHAWRVESGTGARVVPPLRLLAAAIDAFEARP